MRNRFRALAVFALAAALLSAPPADTAVQDTIPKRRYLSPRNHDAAHLKLAGNDRGDQAVVWETYERTRVWVRSRRHGQSFGRPRSLTPKNADVWESAVDVGRDGTEVVAWARTRRRGVVLEAAARRRGGSFTRPKVLTGSPWLAGYLDVAVAGDGRAFVVWTEGKSGQFDRIRAAVRRRDGNWSRPETVADGRDAKLSPDVKADDEGNATLVWEGAGRIRRAFRPTGGHFGRPRAVSHDRHGARDPVLAQNARGDAVVVWSASIDDEHERVAYAFRRAGRDFGPSHALTRRLDFAPIGGAGVDPEGNVVVLWGRFPKAPTCFCMNVLAARRPIGGEFAHPRRLAKDAAGFTTPSVTADARGNLFAVWPVDTERGGSFVTQAKGRWVAADGRLGPRRRLSRKQRMFDPQALLARDGRALVAWIARSNRRERVAAARARVAPPRIGP